MGQASATRFHYGAPMDSAEIEAARHLSAGRLQHTPIPHLPDELRPADLSAAYAIQGALHDLYRTRGHGDQAGYKIGCTTPVMQRYLGIDHPCAGGLLKPTIHQQSADLVMGDFCRPGVECEIAVKLGANLPPLPQPYDSHTVAPAVAAVTAAIEIVDDRYRDYTTFDTPTLVADDFFGAGCIIGPWRSDWQNLDLAKLGGTMAINDEPVGTGLGADIMGHPFAALAWLANHAATRAKPLEAGMIILLGSLVATKWTTTGDIVQINIDELGTAQVRFA